MGFGFFNNDAMMSDFFRVGVEIAWLALVEAVEAVEQTFEGAVAFSATFEAVESVGDEVLTDDFFGVWWGVEIGHGSSVLLIGGVGRVGPMTIVLGLNGCKLR